MSSPDLAALASLFADRTRAAICLALLDGRAWTASELARHAATPPSVARSTTDNRADLARMFGHSGQTGALGGTFVQDRRDRAMWTVETVTLHVASATARDVTPPFQGA